MIERKGNWFQTFSGKKFYPLSVVESDIDIRDIAHALSMTCRYSGHSKIFYSVAEHSVLVSRFVPKELALAALLHDASEAYMTDIPRPLKQMLPEYQKMEHELEAVIARRFMIEFPMNPKIKDVDNRILKNEYDQIMHHNDGPCEWTFYGERLDNCLVRGLSPVEAKAEFLERYYELTQ